jgi:mono/diheme cytochrome c family protein
MPTRRSIARAGGLAVLAAAAVGLSACGGGEADLANGKEKFNQVCTSCHSLADAENQPGSPPIGPNLDDAFRSSRADGFDKDGFRGVVRTWIEYPEARSEPLMPPNLVTGKDADDVAAYVAEVAGTDGESPPRPAEPVEPPTPKDAGAEAAQTSN